MFLRTTLRPVVAGTGSLSSRAIASLAPRASAAAPQLCSRALGTSAPSLLQSCGGHGRRPFHASAPSSFARTRGTPPGSSSSGTMVRPSSRDEEEQHGTVSANTVHLNAFLTKIYTTTGWGVLGLLGTSQLLTSTGLASTMPMPLLVGGLLGGIGSSVLMGKTSPMYTANNEEGIVAVDSTGRQLAFAGLVGSFGAMTAPMFSLVAASNPSIIPAAAVASIATMSGSALYALNSKGDSINAWGPALTGGLFGLIGVGLGGMGCQYLGYYEAAHALHSLSTYGGVVLFAGLTAYDTKVAVDMHALGQPDHLGAAAQLFMNFSNLFSRFMAIFYDHD